MAKGVVAIWSPPWQLQGQKGREASCLHMGQSLMRSSVLGLNSNPTLAVSGHHHGPSTVLSAAVPDSPALPAQQLLRFVIHHLDISYVGKLSISSLECLGQSVLDSVIFEYNIEMPWETDAA